MAIEGVKSFVAEPAYQPMRSQSSNTTSEETAASLETAKSSANMKVEIAKTNESGNNQQSNEEGSGEKKQYSDEEIARKLKSLNKKLGSTNTSLEFGIHEATHRVTIKVLDDDKKEVIKEIPAEKTLDLIAKAWELAGILVDERR